MEKSESSNRIEIPRKSPTVRMVLGDRALALTWYNSLIRIYHAPYGHFNHIEINDPGQGMKGLVFDSDRESRILLTHSWPVRYEPEPDDQVMDIINSRMESVISGGVEKILKSEGRG